MLEDVVREIWAPGRDAAFQATTLAERALIETLVPSLLANARGGRWQADWPGRARAAGFRLEVWRIDGEVFWALLEARDAARGAGAYFFHVTPGAPTGTPELLLQAPHAYYDVGTGAIAARLFFAPGPGPRPRAFFTNTIHRYVTTPGQKQKRRDSPADVCHNPEHLFNVATARVAENAGALVVLQLHGFAGAAEDEDKLGVDDDRGDEVGAGSGGRATIVVSAGRREGSSPRSTHVAARLREAYGVGVERFPEDTSRLGATTNVQGRTLRALAKVEFVHVEVAADLRQQMRGDDAELRRFGALLLRGALEPLVPGAGPEADAPLDSADGARGDGAP